MRGTVQSFNDLLAIVPRIQLDCDLSLLLKVAYGAVNSGLSTDDFLDVALRKVAWLSTFEAD